MLTPASSVRRERVEWLWPQRIPFGAVSLLVGDPGLGKSMLTCWIAARLSREGKNAILATSEDSIAAVVRPRLEAAGADLDRIIFIRMVDEAGEDGLRLPDDTAALEAAIQEEAAVFVSIDPLTAHLPAEVNSWRDQSVRLALAPLHRMAERQGCAVTVVAHLNKSFSAEPLRRIGGSIGIPAAARSALLLARDPDDPDGDEGTSRVLAQVKTNYGLEAPSLLFGIEPILLPATTDDPDVETARLVELGESEHRGEALLVIRGDPEERSAVDEAVSFLEDLLSGAPVPAEDILAAARKNGISEKTLRRAKTRLGVQSNKADFGGHWQWSLPRHEDGQGVWPPLQLGRIGHLRENDVTMRVSEVSSQPESSEDGQSMGMGILGANGRAAEDTSEAEFDPPNEPALTRLGDDMFPVLLANAVRDGHITQREAEERYALHKVVAES
jgi:hypothetical protein